ncbi:uncharacterized protein [Montipora foliosa]|uniref:uncharacterized protein n=1 Tax=Montipora foliosa TaxID=591990 RepID=UPI0035F11D31
MKIVLLSLVVLLAAVVSGQLCVPETLNCHEVIPTIFKLGDGSCACGSKAHDGALKYDKGELYLCLNGKWKAFELKETHKFGTELNPGASCKDILDRADGKQLSDGVYWIRLGEGPLSTSFPVYCDMKSGGWTMAFKAITGSYKERVWEVYKSELPFAEYITKALDVTKQHTGLYKNRIVSEYHWRMFNPSKVRVAVYKSAILVKKAEFDGTASTPYNWFSPARYSVEASSWRDIKYETKNYFSIIGWCKYQSLFCRHFYMSVSWGGCPNDRGWLMISNRGHCDWESVDIDHFKMIIYSKKSTHARFSSEGE